MFRLLLSISISSHTLFILTPDDNIYMYRHHQDGYKNPVCFTATEICITRDYCFTFRSDYQIQPHFCLPRVTWHCRPTLFHPSCPSFDTAAHVTTTHAFLSGEAFYANQDMLVRYTISLAGDLTLHDRSPHSWVHAHRSDPSNVISNTSMLLLISMYTRSAIVRHGSRLR